jgi:hypothetical protein
VLIDALIKVPEHRTEWEPRSEPSKWEAEAVERMKKKLEEHDAL